MDAAVAGVFDSIAQLPWRCNTFLAFSAIAIPS
jgi:hypothetical protein